MSVFAHEYGHDLGLPDLYDTAGLAENSVNYWSLMAQSREDGPNDQSHRHPRLRLGRLGQAAARLARLRDRAPAQTGDKLALGPHEYNSSKAQAAVVVLPKKQVTTKLSRRTPAPSPGGAGPGTTTPPPWPVSVTLPAGTPTLTFQANYNIEVGPPTTTPTSRSTTAPAGRPSPARHRPGREQRHHRRPRRHLDAGRASTCRRTPARRSTSGSATTTDGGVQGNDPADSPGLFVGRRSHHRRRHRCSPTGAETSPNGWTLASFSSVGSTITQAYDNYYIASNRAYVSFDKYLQSGPYNFGYANTKPDFVEQFPYQNGLLVSYWDTSQADNNTSAHPGEGLILPVDANPRPLVAARRRPVASARGRLRLAVLAGEVRLLHLLARQRHGQLHPGPGGRSRCSMTTRRTGTRSQPDREREGAEQRHEHQGAQPEGHLDGDPGLQAQADRSTP